MATKPHAKPASGHQDHEGSRLDPDEQKVADEHSSPRAVVIHEIIREDGELELTRTSGALVLSGLAAGLSMGFSFLTQALLNANLPDGYGIKIEWREGKNVHAVWPSFERFAD